MGDPVQLTDLDVITRYSIAVRAATADRDELLQTLRADLAWLERGRPRSTAFARAPIAEEYDYEEPAAEVDEYDYDDEVEEEPEPRAPIRRMSMPPARRTPARKTATKSTAAKRTTAKKTAAKKTTTRRAR